MKSGNILSLIKHSSNIYAGTSDSGIFKSTNNGQNWIQVNAGINNLIIKSLFQKTPYYMHARIVVYINLQIMRKVG